MSEPMVLGFETKEVKEQMVSANEKMGNIFKYALIAKDTDYPILLTGETGTGKDLLAKIIHFNSGRKNKSFVAVDCTAIPETLIESRLFGHRKGSYTGALENSPGYIESAEGGTVYLDEIGDINQSTQIKLFRLVEEKQYARLGENKLRKADIRIITATNKDLETLVKENKFRDALYYRLKVFDLHLPPLRERPEDIPVLIEHFLRKYSPNGRKIILDPKILEFFLGYDWPGNVRELENLIKKSLSIFVKSELPIETEFISLDFFQQWGFDKVFLKESETERSFAEQVNKFEKELIIKALMKANWVKKEAARILGMPESTLRFKMKQYNITLPA